MKRGDTQRITWLTAIFAGWKSNHHKHVGATDSWADGGWLSTHPPPSFPSPHWEKLYTHLQRMMPAQFNLPLHLTPPSFLPDTGGYGHGVVWCSLRNDTCRHVYSTDMSNSRVLHQRVYSAYNHSSSFMPVMWMLSTFARFCLYTRNQTTEVQCAP